VLNRRSICFCAMSVTVLVAIATLAQQPKTQEHKKKLSTEGKRPLFVTVTKLDVSKNEVWLTNERGETLDKILNAKSIRLFKRIKVGQKVVLFEKQNGDTTEFTDACWRIGNSACGGSENDPCESADVRRVYYKCVDDDGDESYYDDCEPDGCAARAAPKK
jgi:hypothetical protein